MRRLGLRLTLADVCFFGWHALAMSWVTLTITLRYMYVWARVKLLRCGLSQEQWQQVHSAVARRFVSAAIRRKGGLIKVGQFLSARADILPRESITILSRLQDRVDPAPFEWVKTIIGHELGERAAELVDLEKECLAAASFGQVHRAKLCDGRCVVVKVQHRRIERSLRIDLAILRLAFGLFDWLLPRLGLLAVFREIRRATRNELDYHKEADNCRRVAAIFAGDERVVIPTVIEALSTRQVLVLEYIDGIKVTDVTSIKAAGIDPREVAQLLIEVYCYQIYVAGFFHADPHPGNLFVLSGPCLGIVDFGMAKQIPEELLKSLRRGIYAILARDMEELLAAMVQMGLIVPTEEALVQPFLERLAARLQVGDSREFRCLQHELLAQGHKLLAELRSLLRLLDSPRLPEDLVLYGRAISLLQGLVAQLAPDVEIFTLMLPYMLRFLGGGAEPLRRHRPLRSERRGQCDTLVEAQAIKGPQARE